MNIIAIRQQAQQFFDSGQVGEAESLLQNYSELIKADVESCFLLGMVFLKQEKFSQAEVSFKKVLELNPNVYEAHTNLGILYRTQGAFHKAKVHLEKAVHIDPEYIPAWQTLGIVLSKLSAFDHSIACFKKIIELKPDYAVAYNNIGNVYCGNGDLAQGEFWYRRAIAIKNNFLPAQLGLFDIYFVRKEKNKLRNLQEILVEQYPNNTDVAIAFGHAAKLLDDDECILKMLKRCLLEDNHFDQRKQLYFRIARILDRNKDYVQSFSFLQKANQMGYGNYDRSVMEASVNKKIRRFNSNSFDGGIEDLDNGKEFIFIVGMPRSGTSLMEQILDSHPEVKGMGELMYINNLAASKVSLDESNNGLNKANCRRFAQKYRDSLMAGVTVLSGNAPKYFVDKMPTNFLHVGFIRKIFPNARIIHCCRHPLDTGLSNFIQDFGADMSYSYDLSDIGHYYGQYHKLMTHWHAVLDDSIVTVRYERLVNNFEEEVRKILKFCGLPWDSRCLDFHKNKRIVATASREQVSEPLYQSSSGGWTRYSSELEPLKTAFIESGIEFTPDSY